MKKRRLIRVLVRIIIFALVLTTAAGIILSVQTADDSEGEYTPVFADVSDELSPYVELVYKKGIVGASGGGNFGVNDNITFNEAAYITVALYEELRGAERTYTWYSPDIDKYIITAQEYGIWHEFNRDAAEYITLDDAAAILGYYVNGTYPVYADVSAFRGMDKSINSAHVLKLYNSGITLDRRISNAYPTDVYASREDIARLVCMIINPANRLTELKRDYAELETILTEQMAGYEGDWSLYFKDVDNEEVISINSHRVYSASIIKLFVIQAVYEKMNEGSMSDSDSTEELLRRMITWSDNDSWYTLAKQLGGGVYSSGMAYVTKTAQNAGFADTGTFYTGRKKNFNFTSVNDCGNYLNMLLEGRIVNEEYSSRILKLMKQQQVRHKIPAGVPEGIEIANKTGELEYMQGDAAIVYSPSCTYILVVIADSITNEERACSGIKALSEAVYGYVN